MISALSSFSLGTVSLKQSMRGTSPNHSNVGETGGGRSSVLSAVSSSRYGFGGGLYTSLDSTVFLRCDASAECVCVCVCVCYVHTRLCQQTITVVSAVHCSFINKIGE